MRLPQGAVVLLPQAAMIVRDYRTPKGRHEDSGRRPLDLPEPMVGAGGTPWRDQNRTDEARKRLFTRTWTPRPGRVKCEECGSEFDTTQVQLARLCSAMCRQRRYRRTPAYREALRQRRHRQTA